MALATIDASQGYLGYQQYTAFVFQPGIFSDSTITSVTATGLPAGATIDSLTGAISFDASVAVGQYNIGIRVTNSTGTSAVSYFFVVIEPATGTGVAAGSSDVGTDLYFDVESRDVRRAIQASVSEEERSESILFLKSRDVSLANVRFIKQGVLIDPDPTSLKLTLKEFEPDGALITAGGAVSTAFVKSGSGAAAVCKLPIALTGNDVLAALSNYEAQAGTEFRALAELELRQPVSIAATTELVITSRTFFVTLARDQTP